MVCFGFECIPFDHGDDFEAVIVAEKEDVMGALAAFQTSS